jgi:predicted Co/Zn/Cd cation transporter (cation efflux family)
MSDTTVERSAFRLSSYGYSAMAVAGLVFAGLTGSGAILLDGAYSLVSFLMVLLAGRVARLVEQPDSDDFHFGYAYFEPLLNTIRGLLILLLVAFGVGSALIAVFSGGRPLNAGMALVYSIIIGTICISLSVVQRRNAKRTGSPLLEVDARNWFIDGMLTIAVGIAFLGAFVLSLTARADWVAYVDPAVVIVLGMVLIPTPLSIVLGNVGELLHVAPEESIQEEIRRRLDQATEGLALRDRDVRMVKVGRYFYVLVKLITRDDFGRSEIGRLDDIRGDIADALAGCHPRLVLDVVFTANDRWMLGLVGPEEEGGDTAKHSG